MARDRPRLRRLPRDATAGPFAAWKVASVTAPSVVSKGVPQRSLSIRSAVSSRSLADSRLTQVANPSPVGPLRLPASDPTCGPRDGTSRRGRHQRGRAPVPAPVRSARPAPHRARRRACPRRRSRSDHRRCGSAPASAGRREAPRRGFAARRDGRGMPRASSTAAISVSWAFVRARTPNESQRTPPMCRSAIHRAMPAASAAASSNAVTVGAGPVSCGRAGDCRWPPAHPRIRHRRT